jgi:lipopolysaccharide/colanic/teichoic acid biosynthesis glycosyltransferase
MDRLRSTAPPPRKCDPESLKRLVDLAVAGFLLMILSPVLAVIAVAVRLSSAGPVLYRCRRAGLRGRGFDMLKFRKMASDASGPPLTTADDPRFTRLGRFLAAWKLDELPQLWNVIKGEMSLVGPRPEDFRLLAEEPGAYDVILRVRPGITGLSQLAFARESELLPRKDNVRYYVERLLPAKIYLDQLYIARRSIWMDLKIIFWTFAAMLLRCDVSVDRKTARLTMRRKNRHSARTTAVLDRVTERRGRGDLRAPHRARSNRRELREEQPIRHGGKQT